MVGFIVTGGANYKLSNNKFTELKVTTGSYRNQDLTKAMSITSNSSLSEIYIKSGNTKYTYK